MEAWNRSRFQLTIHKTRNLKVLSKSGSHDVYVVISFGKERRKTSTVERCTDAEWEEDCFLKLLSTNEDIPVRLKVCSRNFFLVHDESIGSVDVQLKHHQFYEEPKQSWFKLKNKSKEEVGEILLTFTYLAVSPSKGTMKKSTSIKSLADKLGRRISIRRDSKNISFGDLPREETCKMVDLKILTDTFKDMYQADSDEEVEMRKSYKNIQQHRHTIDFSVTSDNKMFDIDISDSKEDKRHSTSQLKTVLVPDSNLTRFDSYDSLDDKKPFEESISSNEDSVSNIVREVLDMDNSQEDDNVLAYLNRFTKQELVQMVKDQKQWIRQRELYIVDLQSYLNSLLTRILNSNCSILQKNIPRYPEFDDCNKLTTFKNKGQSRAKKWFQNIFGQK